MIKSTKKKTPHPAGLGKIDQPHDQDAEMGILGSILMSPQRLDILNNLEEDDFFIPAHKTIYLHLQEMVKEGTPIDLILATNFLRDRGVLDQIGGVSYITQLFNFVPTGSNWPYYLEIIKDKRLMRDLIERSLKTIHYATAKSDYFSSEQILQRAQETFGQFKKWNSNPPKELPDYIDEKVSRMERGEPDEDLIPTGLVDLDRESPLRQGDLPIIKAARKVGKSTLALSILENQTIHQGRTGIYFSLEDRTSKVVDRVLAGISRVPASNHHVKKLSSAEMTLIGSAVSKISSSNLIIHDDAYDLAKIVNIIRKTKQDKPDLSVAVIDYCQLIRTDVKKNDTREREVATISRTLRLLAMETGVAIILISQVNSDGETRESRALEQDCTASWALLDDQIPNQRTIHVEFQRNGESDVHVPVRFLGNICRIENISA